MTKPKKETQPSVSSLAARGLSKDDLTKAQRARVYASALGQDEHKGQNKNPRKKQS